MFRIRVYAVSDINTYPEHTPKGAFRTYGGRADFGMVVLAERARIENVVGHLAIFALRDEISCQGPRNFRQGLSHRIEMDTVIGLAGTPLHIGDV